MEYPTIYVKDSEFTDFCRSRPWELINENDKIRWLVEIDGVKTIVKPESIKP